MDKSKQEVVIASAHDLEQNSRRDFMRQTGAVLGMAGIMSMVPMGSLGERHALSRIARCGAGVFVSKAGEGGGLMSASDAP